MSDEEESLSAIDNFVVFKKHLSSAISLPTPLLSLIVSYLPVFVGIKTVSPYNSIALTLFMSPRICSVFFPLASSSSSCSSLCSASSLLSTDFSSFSPLEKTMHALIHANYENGQEGVEGVKHAWNKYQYGSFLEELIAKEKMLSAPCLWVNKLKFFTQKIIKGSECTHMRYSYLPRYFLAAGKSEQNLSNSLDTLCFKKFTLYDHCYGCKSQVLCTVEELLLIPDSCEMLVFDFYKSLSGACSFPVDLDLSKYMSAGSHFMEAGTAETPRTVRTTKEEFERTRQVSGPRHWTLVSVILSSGAIIKDRESGCWYDFRGPKVKRFDLKQLYEAISITPNKVDVSFLCYERKADNV